MKFLIRDELCERYQCSRATISRRVATGDLPPPVKVFGSGSARWISDELDANDRKRAAERRLPR